MVLCLQDFKPNFLYVSRCFAWQSVNRDSFCVGLPSWASISRRRSVSRSLGIGASEGIFIKGGSNTEFGMYDSLGVISTTINFVVKPAVIEPMCSHPLRSGYPCPATGVVFWLLNSGSNFFFLLFFDVAKYSAGYNLTKNFVQTRSNWVVKMKHSDAYDENCDDINRLNCSNLLCG